MTRSALRRPPHQATPSPTSRRPRSGSRSSGHIGGLDGLRALAVIAVLVFHLDASWLPGGFLGVDVFFVISGFLITTLLVREANATRAIDLSRFWTRRARRLVPALAFCVPVSIVAARLVDGDLLVDIGRQALGAMTFSTNWLEIGAGTDYFHGTAPQLFMNFWSLAVEEQFYLAWPLVVMLLAVVAPTTKHRAVFALSLAGASTLAMATTYVVGDPATRVYYGTDTHLMGLMLGAALAYAWARPDRWFLGSPSWLAHRTRTITVASLTLVALFLFIDESMTFTYRGGFLLASLATAALIAGAVTTPRFAAALDVPLMTWIGERSYGLYLWHWPTILILDRIVPTAPGTVAHWVMCAVMVATTVVMAAVSYRFVETPVRRHGYRETARRLAAATGPTGPRWTRLVAGVVGLALVATVATIATAPDKSATQELLEANAAAARESSLGDGASAGAAAASDAEWPATTASVTTAPATTPPVATPATASADPPGPASFAMPTGAEIDIIGDSMVVGSLNALKYYFPTVRIDALSNRRWTDAPGTIAAKTLRRGVVIALGTNHGVPAKTVDQILTELGPDRMVVLVNVYGRGSHTAGDNADLAAVVAKHPNTVVADWFSAARAHPDQLQSDRIHPTVTGAHLYASTIRAAFATLSEKHTGTPVTLKDLPIP